MERGTKEKATLSPTGIIATKLDNACYFPQSCVVCIQEVPMPTLNENKKITLHFGGWRYPEPTPIDGAHQFVPMGKPCCKGCGHCGFPADYPLHKKAA